MVYFLGRDVKLAISTEQEAFGIKLSSNVLDITGTSSSSAADTDQIPPRVYGLKGTGTTGVAEVATLTVINADETFYESTSSGSDKYIQLFDPDGDDFVITFEVAGGETYVAPTQAASATASMKITMSTSTGSTTDIATKIKEWINGYAVFSNVFTATSSGAVVTITNNQTGDTTNMVRGAGFTDTILTISAGTVAGVDRSNDLADVTGIDITVGAVDEDIVYMGQRTALKSEIKKDTSITITRKKSDMLFSLLFNQARAGIRHTDGTIDSEVNETDSKLVFHDTLVKPTATAAGSNYGYRVHAQIKSGSEVMSLTNACISEYSTTVSPDGVTEETITFICYTTPKIQSTAYTTLASQTDF
jgi:hypothetical protein